MFVAYFWLTGIDTHILTHIKQVVVYWLLVIFYRLYLSPIRHYPGPKLWAISRLPVSGNGNDC